MDSVTFERQKLSAASLNAAFQIDEILTQNSQDMEEVKTFAQLLSQASGIKAEGQVKQLHSDPVTINSLNRAIHEVRHDHVKDLNELGTRIFELLMVMDKDAFEEKEVLRDIKNFCLGLHKALIEEELGHQDQGGLGGDVAGR